MRTAVLEDDQQQAEFICSTLTAAGHVCHMFASGRALIRQLRRETFDLLIVDWEVQHLSGYDVLRWVRRSHSETLPVIFMTSRGREADIAEVLNAGADD